MSGKKVRVTHHAALHAYQELHDLWVKASPSRRQTTLDDYWHVLKSFADATGRKALTDIGRKDVIAFRDRLLEKGLSATTATHRVGILKTLFNVGIGYELLPVNPAVQVKTARQHGKARIPFSADDLARIFHSPLYAGHPLPQAGGREAAYWLPLLALFTGARVEELAQLLVKDVRHVPELGHYLNISDEAEHAKLKNAASRRRVPVHPVLVACGFIDYVQQVKDSRFLFPHLKPNPRGKLGGYFSNFFSRYLRRRVRITNKRKVFHSFRHTFKDACRKVGIEEAVHDALTGHTGNAVSRQYGNELYPLEPLFAAMERYDIADLDLSHLYKRPVAKPLRAGDIRLIAAFYGVLVAFTAARVRRDMAPFVVALCESAEAGIDVATNQLLYGRLPANKLLLVNAWIELHREELLASWQAGRLTGEYVKVEPLR
ncbi:MAG: phage integrase N-terminal SAM-like domain-containing protein [Rhodocyclaceae bacterium]|nr:phage integrase N-terminal SAM-like domain-containing protein [Rhodocyclaceae bacterium]